MSKNKRKKKILRIIKSSSSSKEYYNLSYKGLLAVKLDTHYLYETWVSRPNVAVNLWKIGDEDFQSYGFSKVNWPDCWDEKRGIEIALSKAAAQLVKA